MDELRDAFNDAWEESDDADLDLSENLDVQAPDESKTTEANNDVDILDDVKADESTATADVQTPDTGKSDEGKAGEAKTENITEDKSSSEPPKGKEPDTEKAPVSWSAKAREDWAGVPANARLQIQKREREVSQVLQESSEARKGMKQLHATLSPHMDGLIASGASNPMSVVSDLLQAESTLRVGSQTQKAERVAEIIQRYGVDIQALDNILVGKPAPNQPMNQMEQMIEQRMAPVNQYLQQQQQQQQYQQQQKQETARSNVNAFREKAEFLDDVRNDMADLMDASTARGVTMTLQDAYNKACAINPEISSVLEGRQRQQNLLGSQNNILGKKSAASTLRGSPGGSGGNNSELSMRDTISELWNSQG